MNLTNFRFETDADGIALVTWDMPGRSMNVINAEVVGELGQITDKIASDQAIKGAVFTSGKDGFAAGADLTMLETAGKEYARRAKAEALRKRNENPFANDVTAWGHGVERDDIEPIAEDIAGWSSLGR